VVAAKSAVDSKPIAFEIAGAKFSNCASERRASVARADHDDQISIPNRYSGEVMNDLNTKRGVSGMTSKVPRPVITASVPLAEVQKSPPTCASITQGAGILDGA